MSVVGESVSSYYLNSTIAKSQFISINMSECHFISVSDQYARFPDLSADEVKKLQDWAELQPHLPDISGELDAKNSVYSSCANHSPSKFTFGVFVYSSCIFNYLVCSAICGMKQITKCITKMSLL